MGNLNAQHTCRCCRSDAATGRWIEHVHQDLATPAERFEFGRAQLINRVTNLAFTIAAVAIFSLGGSLVALAQDRDVGFEFDPTQMPPRAVSEFVLEPGLPEICDEGELLKQVGLTTADAIFLGAVTYGDELSRSVPVMLTNETPPRLLVDLDRDHRFHSSEGSVPVNDSHDGWLVELDAEFVDEDSFYIHQTQSVRFRYDRSSDQLLMSTAGVMAGTVIYRDQPAMARIEDRNANGRWFDPDDRLFVDLNHDGRIDPILERVPVQGLRVLDGQLMAIMGDRMGRRIEFQAVETQGQIRPLIELLDDSTEVVSLSAILASTSGMQFQIDSLAQSIEVPTGDYFVDSVRLQVRGEAGRYRFVFQRQRTKPQPQRLDANQQIEIDLLGDLRMTSELSTVRGSDDYQLVITPMVRTSSGLYLTDSRFGATEAISENRLRSSSSYESFSALGSTGFS